MVTITQGESYPIYITLRQDGRILTPELVADVKICIGNFHKTLSEGGVQFDAENQRWWIKPTQEETMSIPAASYMATAHVAYADGTVLITPLDYVMIRGSCCGEVL